MAEHVAAIKLTLKDQGFNRTFDSTANHVKGSAAGMGRALRDALSAGAKGGLDAVKNLGSRIKDLGGTALGLVGVAGFGGLVKGAVDADDKFRKLAHTMKAGEGAFKSVADIQRFAESTAKKWGQSSMELADALEIVNTATGDTAFAKDTLGAIATQATASGQSVQTLAGIVSAMNEQFGITAEQVPGALAAVIDLGRQGGLSIEEISANLGAIGKTAGEAGFKGVDGLKLLLATANTIEGKTKSAGEAVRILQTTWESLLGNKEKVTKLHGMGIKTEGRNGLEILSDLIKKTEGDTVKLSAILGANATEIAATFGGIGDLDAAMRKVASTTSTAADAEKKA
ncbi:MAG: phage tail tape measure protein, partial [Alphaproteobacteria bacterium]